MLQTELIPLFDCFILRFLLDILLPLFIASSSCVALLCSVLTYLKYALEAANVFLNAIRNSCKILTPAPAVPFGTLLGFFLVPRLFILILCGYEEFPVSN